MAGILIISLSVISLHCGSGSEPTSGKFWQSVPEVRTPKLTITAGNTFWLTPLADQNLRAPGKISVLCRLLTQGEIKYRPIALLNVKTKNGLVTLRQVQLFKVGEKWQEFLVWRDNFREKRLEIRVNKNPGLKMWGKGHVYLYLDDGNEPNAKCLSNIIQQKIYLEQ